MDAHSLYDQHFDDIYAYVAYRLGGHREAVRDIVQEVFLAALRRLEEFRPDRPALVWLRAIARRKVADHFRRSGRRRVGQLGDPIARDPGESSQAEERALRVSAAMDRLPDRYAELLEAKYLDSLSVKQIAEHQGETEKAIESALHRARDAFRDAYAAVSRDQEVRP